MPANNSKGLVHYWAGCFGSLGHLYSPGKGNRRGPYLYLPYALDNGAFPAFTKGVPWDPVAYLELLTWTAAQKQRPLWALVPDVVTDRAATIARWHEWEPRLRAYRWPLAFAVQDGMTPADVPAGVAVVFVGGSTKRGTLRGWKWDSLPMWCRAFPRVHVGRVNGYEGLVRCAELGVESCDGTGWFRGDQKQLAKLENFLMEQSHGVVYVPVVDRITRRIHLRPAVRAQRALAAGRA